LNSIEDLILHNLIKNDSYSRKVLPFIQREYFINKIKRLVFETVQEYITKYGNLPTKEALIIILDKNKGLSESESKEVITILDDVCKNVDSTDVEWLVTETETFCREKAVYNAIMESINIIDGKSANTKGAIPEILSKALAVSFDPNVGHDYLEDYSKRYDFYHLLEKKIPFDLEYFNAITKDGITAKTLNVVMAGTGVGKSLFLCHHASYCLKNNMNVLYITCEMAEEKIAERIDANILDTNLDDMRAISKTIYEKKIKDFSETSTGKLIIKEYPTGTPNVNHFRFLLDELRLKKKFKPDIIFVDYLNICSSSRIKKGKENSYEYIKAIAEEMRGLAIEYNVPLFTATQTNRAGYGNTDVDLENTSESFGLPATCDFMFALIATDELDELNQVLVKQLKNRYNDKAKNRKFIVGIDRGKMRLFDVKKEEQGLINSGQEKKIQDFFEPKPKNQGVDGWNNTKSKKDFTSWNV
jgi:replicative DNA helicase